MDPNPQLPKKWKVMLIGDVAVGKTSFRTRYIRDVVKTSEAPTIGVEYETTPIVLKDSTTAKVVLWDTAGSEKYLSLTTAHYKQSHGALLFFDLTDRETFDHVSFWLSQIADKAEEDTIVMLIGNKSDLVKDNPSARKVSEHEAREFAQKYGLMYHETSAKTGKNVKEAFSDLLEAINRSQMGDSSRDAKEKEKERNLKIRIYRELGKLDEGHDHNEAVQPNRCCC